MKHQKGKSGNRFVRLVAVFLAAALLLASLPAAPADAQSGAVSVTAEYYTVGNAHRIRNFELDDAWFTGDPSEYSHPLARASLGMAVSAVRDVNVPLGYQDHFIRAYLNGAGFSDLRSDGYGEPTETHTVSTLIGSKKIGDMTLVAVAVCGGNYTKEWAGNMTVGSGTRHQGFQIASEKVQQRIREYVAERGFTSDIRLWIAGYSRAAAISNITAADMTDSGLFSGVFAYTFATPRTTREENKKHYGNIFNIIGANDVVPMVPLADWGYRRYGRDLYLPSQETDSAFSEMIPASDEIARALTGKGFRNNPPVNNVLRTVLDYLYLILPTPETYEENVQDEAVVAMADAQEGDRLEAVGRILKKVDDLPENQMDELDKLIDYLEQFANVFLREDNPMIDKGYWDEEAPITDNVMHEHNFDVYLEWMLSEDDENVLFTPDPGSVRLTVSETHAAMWVVDEYGFIAAIDENGNVSDEMPAAFAGELEREEDAPKISLFVERNGTQTIIALPRDTDFLITLRTDRPETIKYFATIASPISVKRLPTDVFTLNAQPDIYYFVYLDKTADKPEDLLNGNANSRMQAWKSGLPYSPSAVLKLENANVFHLRVEELIGFTMILICVLTLALLNSVVLWIIRLVQHRKRATVAAIVFHLLVAALFFLMEEVARTVFSRFAPVRIIFRGIVSLTLLMLAFRGWRLRRTAQNRFVVLTLTLFLISDILMTFSLVAGTAVSAAGIILLCCAFVTGRPSPGQIVAWLSLWAASFAGAFALGRLGLAENTTVPVILYGGVLAAAAVLSFRTKYPYRAGTILLVLARTSMLSPALTEKLSVSPGTILMVYYTAVAVLAASVWERTKREFDSGALPEDPDGAEPPEQADASGSGGQEETVPAAETSGVKEGRENG